MPQVLNNKRKLPFEMRAFILSHKLLTYNSQYFININQKNMSSSESPKKITIVTFTAFNMKGQMVLEDVEESKVQEFIRRKTSNTAVIHTTTEYDVSNKKYSVINEDTMGIQSPMSEKFISDMYEKLGKDGNKKKKDDDGNGQ
jgi:hypothetical protein